MNHSVEMHPDASARKDQLSQMHQRAQQKLQQARPNGDKDKSPQHVDEPTESEANALAPENASR
jgi:hypothetical protein